MTDDHRDKAKELLLHYFQRVASAGPMSMDFVGDSVLEIERIVDEILEATQDAMNDGLVEHGRHISAIGNGLVTDGERLDAIVGNLASIVARLDQLEDRRREEERDRIAINGLRLSIDRLSGLFDSTLQGIIDPQ